MKKYKKNDLIFENRKARHLYTILDTFEAGIILEGWQAKSIRTGKCSFSAPYILIENNTPRLIGLNIVPLETLPFRNLPQTNVFTLLLNSKEIDEIKKKIMIKGFTVVPLDLHYTNGRVKVKIAICQGKKIYDKREEIKQKDLAYEQRRYQD